MQFHFLRNAFILNINNMGVEDGGDSQQIRDHIKQRVEQGFSGGRKLYGDSYNNFGWLQGYAYTDSIQTIPSNFLPLRHYEEDMRARYKTDQDEVDYVMQMSDPVAVAAYDQFIDELNANLERIVKEKDVAALDTLLERGSALVYKKG
ncbi:MAG: hypothetical protein Q7K54_04385 [Candidatus Parcubacteria bacterium]|nr:hypothetical protein [Candidatus Parcubacteria bacterium]